MTTKFCCSRVRDEGQEVSVTIKATSAARVHKDLPLANCELKFVSTKADDPVTFQGYASVWGRKDSYGDTVLKGAFAKSLKDRRPMMFFGHSPGRIIGKWTEIDEDDKGLLVKGELTPGHSDAMNCAASLKHGALTGLSIGGYTDEAEHLNDGGRIIKSFDLWEISVVSMPAEHEARIDTSTVKAQIDDCKTIRDVERLLRDAGGLSNGAATALVAKLRNIVRGELERDAQVDATRKQAASLLAEVRELSIPKSLRRI